MEFVYAVWSTIFALQYTLVKVGCWGGSIKDLHRRYATVYGKSLGLMVFQCSNDRFAEERFLHTSLSKHHIENELFRSECLAEIPYIMSHRALDHVLHDEKYHTQPLRNKKLKLTSEEEPVAILRCMLFDEHVLQSNNIYVPAYVTLKARLTAQIVCALGLQGPFDTQHTIRGYDNCLHKLLQTDLFSQYEQHILLFQTKAATDKSWNINASRDITESLKIVFRNIGIRLESHHTVKRNNGTRVRQYYYDLNVDDVKEMIVRSKLV